MSSPLECGARRPVSVVVLSCQCCARQGSLVVSPARTCLRSNVGGYSLAALPDPLGVEADQNLSESLPGVGRTRVPASTPFRAPLRSGEWPDLVICWCVWSWARPAGSNWLSEWPSLRDKDAMSHRITPTAVRPILAGRFTTVRLRPPRLRARRDPRASPLPGHPARWRCGPRPLGSPRHGAHRGLGI